MIWRAVTTNMAGQISWGAFVVLSTNLLLLSGCLNVGLISVQHSDGIVHCMVILELVYHAEAALHTVCTSQQGYQAELREKKGYI